MPPTLTSISQAVGSTDGGTYLTIDGTNLSDATAVYFGGVPADNFRVGDDGTLVAYIPPGDPSTVDVTVVTLGGTTEVSPADRFTYILPPVVTGIAPVAGPFDGGTEVTISGAGFAYGAAVDFGSYPATSVTVLSDGAITATAPLDYGFLFTVDVTVVTPGGTSATSTADQFTYATSPGVTGLSVSSGSHDGGDEVAVYGFGLDLATAVYFGSSPAAITDIVSSGEIDVVSPAGQVGATVDVTVVTLGGVSPANQLDQFSYFQPAPAVTGVSPAIGPSAGGETVTITGTDLNGTSEVDFGGVASPRVTVVSSSEVTATVPAGTLGQVDVTVTTPAGTSAINSADEFTGVTPPVVTSISTADGAASGGDYVTIYGSDLDGATAVTFGSTAVTPVVHGGYYVIAQSPGGAPGSIHISVTTAAGTSATSAADLFTYVGTPTAAADSYSVAANGSLTVDAADGALANDTAPQGVPLTAIELTYPLDGYLTFNADGSFGYTPNYGFTGTDSFIYEATNGYATSAPTTVTFTVSPPTLGWTSGASGNWTDALMGAALPIRTAR